MFAYYRDQNHEEKSYKYTHHLNKWGSVKDVGYTMPTNRYLTSRFCVVLEEIIMWSSLAMMMNRRLGQEEEATWPLDNIWWHPTLNLNDLEWDFLLYWKDPETGKEMLRLLILGVNPSSIGQEWYMPLEIHRQKETIIISDMWSWHHFLDETLFPYHKDTKIPIATYNLKEWARKSGSEVVNVMYASALRFLRTTGTKGWLHFMMIFMKCPPMPSNFSTLGQNHLPWLHNGKSGKPLKKQHCPGDLSILEHGTNRTRMIFYFCFQRQAD